MLVLALWNGWQRGFVLQVASLAGCVAGIWIASRFGGEAGQALGLDPQVAFAGGFVALLVGIIVAVAVVGRLLRGLFRFAGLGVADVLLGIAVSVLKYLLVLSFLFSAFDRINADSALVEQTTLDSSKGYRPVMRISETLFPFLEEISGQLPAQKEKTTIDG